MMRSQRTKYIEVDCHFIRDAVSRKMISTLFSPSSEELVDIFTKHIPLGVFFHYSETSWA